MSVTPNLIAQHFSEMQEKYNAPSIAYGVRVAGDVIASHNTTQQFRIASMTKSFVAAAVLALRDAGSVSLDAPVGTYVPELVGLQLPTTDSPPVTVRDLLTMSSGIATDDAWGDRQLDIDSETFSDWLREGVHFATAPATSFVYSNYGYAILGRVITNVSGQPFQRFIQDLLLHPLGMQYTSWTPLGDNFALPHRVQDGVAIADEPDVLGDGEFAAMAGIWTTVDNLLLWTEFLADAFPARDEADSAVLRRSSRREMQQLHCLADGSRFTPAGTDRSLVAGYGMGLLVIQDPRIGRIIEHSGGLPGYGSNMAWLPDRDVQIICFANVTYASLWRVNFRLLDTLETAELIPPQRPVDGSALRHHAEALVQLFNDWTNERADDVFTMNVALDDSYTRRKQDLAKFGTLQLVDVGAVNAAEASATVVDDVTGNTLRLSFSLSPQRHPRIQSYELQETNT